MISRREEPADADKSIAGETLMVMLEQECTTYSCQDYLMDARDLDKHHEHIDDHADDTDSCAAVIDDKTPGCRECKVSAEDRKQIVDWCYAIIDQFRFSKDTVAVAMNTVDRFINSLSSDGWPCNPQDCHIPPN